MKRHHSHLPSRRNCLGATCGTNIDLEGIEFTNQRSNLVYMDKVFSFNEDTSCPLLFNLNTGGMNQNNFTAELTLDGKGCSLVPCTLSPNAVFNVERSFVVVEYFNTRPPGNIHASQVTVDGYPVDSVSYSNGQYTAKTASIIPRVQNDRCLEEGLPTKTFFLINNAGPWDFRAKYVLEGTVNTDGRTCCFRAEISNAPNSNNTSLPSNSLSNFSIPNLSLPCSIDGIAPDILFQFKANIHMVNPRLVVDCRMRPPLLADAEELSEDRGGRPRPDCCCPPSCCGPGSILGNTCTVALVTTLAVEPVVHVETVRRTLFCVNACEGLKPCDGSVRAAEEEEDEECALQTNPCSCGRGRDDDDRDRDRDRCRDRDRGCGDFEMPCGDRTVGGITIGTGNCRCNDGREIRGDRRGDKGGCREDLLDALCDLLAEIDCVDSTSDCSQGVGKDGTLGCGCNAGRDRDRDQCRDTRTRTAFQFNGTNGCCW